MEDEAFGGTRALGWAACLALAVAAGLAVLYAVASRLAGAESVLLLGTEWSEGTDTRTALTAVAVGLVATAAGVLGVRRLAPARLPSWQWFLAAAVLVIPVGAVLEPIARTVVALLVPATPA